MKRRQFLTTASVAGVSSIAGLNTHAASQRMGDRQLLEMRLYHTNPGNKRRLLNDVMKGAILPAYGRLGVGPIGVFEPVHGMDSLTLVVLVPHKSFESLLAASAGIATDADYQKGAEALYSASLSDALYTRIETSLMLAFERMPTVELSPLSRAGKPRIFEMRTYESHHGKAGKRKIEMFNAGGEIEIFRKTGLQPVFFGETLIGPRIPNLTYMVVFPDWNTRDKAWDTFRNHPDWKKLSADPYYADTVSNITDIILRPAPYSQI